MSGTKHPLDLVAPAERAFRRLSTRGIDFYEVCAVYSRSLDVSLLGKGVKDADSSVDVGLGIRAFKHGGRGGAFSQSLDPGDVEVVVERAVSFAMASQPDPHFKDIPGPAEAPEVEGLCDKNVVGMSLEQLSEHAKEVVEAPEEVRKAGKYEGSVGASHMRSFLMTSTGVSFESEKTLVSAWIAPTYRDGEDVGSSHEFDYGVSISDIDLVKVGRKAAEKAVAQFGARRMEGGVLPAVLAPEAASSLFSGLLFALSGEAAAKGRTFASNLVGEQIAPETVGIGDDGTIPGAISSAAYDGEGVPTRPTTILRGGEVLTLLHNSYSAGIAGVGTNGHAHRGSYGLSVGAGPMNTRVNPGDSSMQEMVVETKRGILVTGASFHPNMVSGEFSSTIDEGFLIENGEKKHPIKNMMVGGHILDLYRDVELISKEGRTIGKGYFYPAVKIGQMKLAGAGTRIARP